MLEWIKANDGPEYSEEDLYCHWNPYLDDNLGYLNMSVFVRVLGHGSPRREVSPRSS
jgi:hypothetical protein